MIVNKALKEYFKEKDMNLSGDFKDALEVEVKIIIDKAIERTKNNNRKNVRGSDL